MTSAVATASRSSCTLMPRKIDWSTACFENSKWSPAIMARISSIRDIPELYSRSIEEASRPGDGWHRRLVPVLSGIMRKLGELGRPGDDHQSGLKALHLFAGGMMTVNVLELPTLVSGLKALHLFAGGP